MTDQPTFRFVNTAHRQQDIHGARPYRPGMHRFQVAASLIPPPPRENASCLDVGGGMGEVSEILRSIGYRPTLVDLSEGNCAAARERGFDAVRADLNQGLGPVPPESVDGVVMLEVIEHIVNAEHLLSEVSRVLRPGGFLVLSTPNFGFFKERARAVRGRPPQAEGYHYRFFTIASLRELIAREPLRIEAERYSVPAIGLNRLNRLRGRKRRHVMVPAGIAPLFAQTTFVLAYKDR